MVAEMTTKCADWVNVKKYVELEHYLVYVKGSVWSSEGIYCVEKETGKREMLLDVSNRTVEAYGKVQRDLCMENICGVGDTLFVFCEDYYLKINVSTKEIEQEDVFAGDTRANLFSVMNATKLYPQCNEEYLLYSVSNTMYLVNLATGKTDKVRDSSRKEVYAYSYRLWKDKIYYIYDEKIYVYDIKSKKASLLYEPLGDMRVDLFAMNEHTINYDEFAVDFFEDNLYLAQYDEEEYVHKIAIISLDGSGEIEELKLETTTDAEEITTKLIKDGCLYYVTANKEAQIVKYDLRSEEETILEEESSCVIAENNSGFFSKCTSYMAGNIQIVGKWLYYEDNYGNNTHRIPIDGGDCVCVKVKK